MFEFYFLKFRNVWILNPEVLKFGGLKFKHSQILGSKIQILKFEGVKFIHPQTQGDKNPNFEISGYKVQTLPNLRV